MAVSQILKLSGIDFASCSITVTILFSAQVNIRSLSTRNQNKLVAMTTMRTFHHLEQKFWFPDNKSKVFSGNMFDDQKLEIEVITVEDNYYIAQSIRGKDSFVIHGNLSNKKKITVHY